MTTPERIEVAVGIVLQSGRPSARSYVLISRRSAGGVLGGYWEFPGGKLEANETAEACVVRELREELGIAVRPASALRPIEHRYEHARVVLRPFICTHIGGKPRALQVEAWKWVAVDELDAYRFPPANAALLKQLREALNGSASSEAE